MSIGHVIEEWADGGRGELVGYGAFGVGDGEVIIRHEDGHANVTGPMINTQPHYV